MSRITPGSSYTTPGAQRTISSIQQSQRNHPYSNSPSTSSQKYTNRNTLSGGGTVSSASPKTLQKQVWARTFGGREYSCPSNILNMNKENKDSCLCCFVLFLIILKANSVYFPYSFIFRRRSK